MISNNKVINRIYDSLCYINLHVWSTYACTKDGSYAKYKLCCHCATQRCYANGKHAGELMQGLLEVTSYE